MSQQNIVVIGNGVVGYKFCGRLSDKDVKKQYKIITFCEEPYVSAGRSLLIKHIKEKYCFEWQNLIGRHNITLRHSEQDLSWIVPAEKRALVDLKDKIIHCLNVSCLSFADLYIALDPVEFECGAQIIIRSQKITDTYTYQVLHKEDFDYRNSSFIFAGYNLSLEHLVEVLYSLRKMFFQRSLQKGIVVLYALKPCEDVEAEMNVYQCPNCLTQYHEKVGQPHIGIASGTSCIQLPDNWVCELCETPREYFIKM